MLEAHRIFRTGCVWYRSELIGSRRVVLISYRLKTAGEGSKVATGRNIAGTSENIRIRVYESYRFLTGSISSVREFNLLVVIHLLPGREDGRGYAVAAPGKSAAGGQFRGLCEQQVLA